MPRLLVRAYGIQIKKRRYNLTLKAAHLPEEVSERLNYFT